MIDFTLQTLSVLLSQVLSVNVNHRDWNTAISHQIVLSAALSPCW